MVCLSYLGLMSVVFLRYCCDMSVVLLVFSVVIRWYFRGHLYGIYIWYISEFLLYSVVIGCGIVVVFLLYVCNSFAFFFTCYSCDMSFLYLWY